MKRMIYLVMWATLMSAMLCRTAKTAGSAQAELRSDMTLHLPRPDMAVYGSLFRPDMITAVDATAIAGRKAVWDVGLGKELASLSGGSIVSASGNGRFLAVSQFDSSGDQMHSTIYEIPGMRKRWERDGDPCKIHISDDGAVSVCASINPRRPFFLEFRAGDGRLTGKVEGHHNASGDARLARDGSYFAAAVSFIPDTSVDGTVTTYGRTGRILNRFTPTEAGLANRLRISPTGSTIICSFAGRAVDGEATRLWISDYALSRQLSVLSSTRTQGDFVTVEGFSSNGRYLSHATPKAIVLRENGTQRVVWRLGLDASPFTDRGSAPVVLAIAVTDGGDKVAVVLHPSDAAKTGVQSSDRLMVVGGSGELIATKDITPDTRLSPVVQWDSASCRLAVASGGSIEYYSFAPQAVPRR